MKEDVGIKDRAGMKILSPDEIPDKVKKRFEKEAKESSQKSEEDK
jgi:hypothetical protein